ncbi:hypothetical protein ABBQ38_012297 [Trebouxia sp. C0009 RCD-2024]
MPALSRTSFAAQTLKGLAVPRGSKLLLSRSKPLFRRPASSRKCTASQSLAPSPENMCAIVSAARDEEAPEHAQDSKLTLAGHTLEGISIAGQETCIILPSLNLAFDSGRCPQRSVYRRKLFLSHEHLDHMGGIPFHICSRQMLGLPPTRLFIPDFLEGQITGLLNAYRAFQRCDMPCEVTPMQVHCLAMQLWTLCKQCHPVLHERPC